MTKDKKIKICILTISLKNGGLERSCVNLFELLNKVGYDTHMICLSPEIDYKITGRLFIVKKKTKSNNIFEYALSFYKLRRYIIKHKIDYIIDNRTRTNSLKELFYLYYIFNNVKVIYMVHNSQINKYFPKHRLIAQMMISKSEQVITVSNGIQSLIEYQFHTTNCTTIFNYIPNKTIDHTLISNDRKKYILFLGRIDNEHKNLSLLIKSYQISQLYPELKLYIVGSGPDSDLISNEIKNNRLEEYVKTFPFTPQVSQYILHAKFLVLSSRYEGLPMVLGESLSLGTPVVSVDCKFGPSEIIQHETNGLLVENNNPKALANAMKRMINDRDLYDRCTKNAISSIKHLGKEAISKEWQKVLQ
ncbi:glycosyltransferase [Saccharicrinis sp. GN24d3]|uniref:glycosyltransferase n=1 Tax=Saccharicrinis sp. GN24d3 TaxID=3458416 RepID=UPI0040355B75